MIVSGPGDDWLGDGIILDKNPTGLYSTAFTTRSISGAHQIGGRPAGRELPNRQLVLPFDLWDTGDGIEATLSRFRRLWGIDNKVTWKYTTVQSGPRSLILRLAREIEVTTEGGLDREFEGHVHVVVSAIAFQPMYEGLEDEVSWSNPTSGVNVGWLRLWNPTDQPLWLEWSMEPATQWRFPDMSFGQEKLWRRAEGADADRIIYTPSLTQRLHVMADPMMETYVSEDGSNVAGLFNGVEPMYAVPPYTAPIEVPVVCNGAAGATITMTMRRFWSAESGLDERID